MGPRGWKDMMCIPRREMPLATCIRRDLGILLWAMPRLPMRGMSAMRGMACSLEHRTVCMEWLPVRRRQPMVLSILHRERPAVWPMGYRIPLPVSVMRLPEPSMGHSKRPDRALPLPAMERAMDTCQFADVSSQKIPRCLLRASAVFLSKGIRSIQ